MHLYQLLLQASLFFATAARAKCTLSAIGNPQDILLKGTVLTPAGALPNGHVLIQSGKIAHVGSHHRMRPKRFPENLTVISCPNSVISPGFINTHEHLEFSTVSPFPETGERFSHRHDWRLGLRGHTMRDAPVNGSEEAAVAWGELRHLFSGTTSVVGGAMVPGLVRNLDFVEGLEDGVRAAAVTWDTFPLDDVKGILRNGDCDYGADATGVETAGKLYRYIAHVGEGVDAEARNEFLCLSSETYDTIPNAHGGGLSTDLLLPNLALVHALGLEQADFDLVARRKASVVWSPRSNISLYGKTLNVTYLLDAGIVVALGTDWLPSGSATMAREAVCAATATRRSYGRELAAKTLWEMMTVNAARVAGFEQHIGALEVGKVADIVVFAGEVQEDPFAQAAFADSRDLELVLRGGKVLLADGCLMRLAHGACELADFGRRPKVICVQEELGMNFATFEASLNGVYPAILPRVPAGEPTCEPIQA